MIRFDQVTKCYGESTAVDALSLEIDSGEIVVFAGPSGCGKTTSLKMINRLIEPTSGTILIDGLDTRRQNPTTLRRSIGYVIQQGGLFPHQSVADNVATVPRLLGWDRARIRARVFELLELVGLPPPEFAARLPSELSGGQRQRVGVARALGADPPILLLDEPFGAIDPIVRGNLQDELLRLQRIVRKTMVLVTHDIDEAIKLGDRIALMGQGGRLAQVAAPAELLAHPASTFVNQFLGGSKFVRRLGLIALRDVRLGPPGQRPLATTPLDATLRDALDALLQSSDGCVSVMDGERVAGTLDADAIRLAAQ